MRAQVNKLLTKAMHDEQPFVHETNISSGIFLIFLIVLFQILVARWKLSREAKRRWQHALTGQALVLVAPSLPKIVRIIALSLSALAIYTLRNTKFFKQAFGPLLRKDEHLPGAFYFLLGTLCTHLIFSLEITLYAVECLAWADPLAAWIGQSFHSRKLPGQTSATLFGSLTNAGVAWLIGYWYWQPSPKDLPTYGSITMGALSCAFFEAYPILNDNFCLPLATALVYTMTRKVWKK